MKRRELLKLAGATAALTTLGKLSLDWLADPEEDLPEWPTNPQEIIAKIEALPFPPGSQLGTTVVPRKVHWELVQVQQAQGQLPPELPDESAWHQDPTLFRKATRTLADSGLSFVRLAVFPFELTADGITYNLEPLEQAIQIQHEHGLQTQVCLGPVNFPYHPGGRVPKELQDLLAKEIAETGQRNLTLGPQLDPRLPQSSVAIRHFTFRFLEVLLGRYAHDPRVSAFYIGNEWPDTNTIEGVDGTITVEQSLMSEFIRLSQQLTDKPLILNTNIHPLHPQNLQAGLGALLHQMGGGGQLGLDVYPSQEMKIPELRQAIPKYDGLIEHLRRRFPQTQLVFTELQGEPWSPEELIGRSWYDILTTHPELVEKYYREQFPPTLQSHLLASGIRQVSLWGAPLWVVGQELGYTFPLELTGAMGRAMRKSSVGGTR